ncbi:MAG: 50S ribosomal protein L32 [Chloroflexi bacterium]|nr:50S ribosomal protein L32 [Chloroflexota bacterium]
MGPLPKRKVSKSRRNRRRAHDALTLNHLVECEGCGEYHIAHRVCLKCGWYRDTHAIEMNAD